MIKGSLFSKAYTCLFDKTKFSAWKIYPSARDRYERGDELLDVPVYRNPGNDENFCNYTLIEVKVCPACAFASAHDSHFLTDDPYNQPMEIADEQMEAIQQGAPSRLALAKTAKELQGEKRTYDDAIIAFKLAVSSSMALVQSDRKRFAGELPAIANYALKTSQLCLEAGYAADRDRWLHLAHEYFKNTIECEVRGAAYYRSIYQLAAISVYLGEDLTASRCYEILTKESRAAHHASLTAYHNRVRKIWQDRDLYRRKEA